MKPSFYDELDALFQFNCAICRTDEIGCTPSRMRALPPKLGGKRCKNLYPHHRHIRTFGLHMKTNHLTYLHAHRPCSKWALFSRTQGSALLAQRFAGMALLSQSRAVNLFTAVFRASWLKVLNVRNGLKALGSLNFQQDWAPLHMQARKWLDATFIGRTAMHHACPATAPDFSYLECWF